MKQTKINRSYHWMVITFVTLLLCSNLIGANKVCHLGGITFGSTLFFFPITYLLNAILTEIYGTDLAKEAIWLGFGALLFASFVSWSVIQLPPAPEWPYQQELQIFFGHTPRLVCSSLLAYLAGTLTNTYVFSKIKQWTHQKWLGARIIGAAFLGEGIDSLLFYPLAFYQLWPTSLLIKTMIGSYFVKVFLESFLVPISYKIISWLKFKNSENKI